MKIAVRRRLAAAAVLSMTATVATVILTAGTSSATVVSVNPPQSGNFGTDTITFTLAATNPNPVTGAPATGRVPLGSNVHWQRHDDTDDDFDSTVDNYGGTPPSQQQ